MLLITRKWKEAIIINDNIIIRPIDMTGWGQVKIGIDAPPEVEIYREEIYERIKINGKMYRKQK